MQDLFNNYDLVKDVKKTKRLAMGDNIVRLFIPLPLVIIMVGVLILQISFGTFGTTTSGIIGSINLIVQGLGFWGRKMKKRYENLISSISSRLDDKTDHYVMISEPSDFKIIPRNFKIGEDLTHNNIVPVFAKGNYILIKNSYNTVAMRQYEKDDKDVVELLEPNEVNDLIKELETKDQPKRLSLGKK